MDKPASSILTGYKTGSAGEIQGMIQVLMSELGASQYKITVENQQVWLRSKVEDCDTSYPLSVMLCTGEIKRGKYRHEQRPPIYSFPAQGQCLLNRRCLFIFSLLHLKFHQRFSFIIGYWCERVGLLRAW
jgi:hypothetical protein